MADAAKQSKEDDADTRLHSWPSVHKCISELRIVAPREVHTHFDFFFGSSQTSPPFPPTTASTWKNLLRLIVSLARTRTLSLSLSTTTNMAMYSAYVQGLRLLYGTAAVHTPRIYIYFIYIQLYNIAGFTHCTQLSAEHRFNSLSWSLNSQKS